MRKFALLLGIAFCVALTPPGALRSEDCDAVIKGGVFRNESLKSNNQFGQDVLDYFCSSQQSVRDSSLGIGLTIPLEGIPIVGNFAKKDGSFNQAKACQSASKKNSAVLGEDIQKRYGDADILDAWKFCIKTNADAQATGLVCSSSSEKESPEQLTIGLNWRPTSGDQKLKATIATANLACGFSPTLELNPFQRLIGLCSRSNLQKPAKFIVNTDAPGTSCDVSLPALPEPDPLNDCLAEVKQKYPLDTNPKAAAGIRCCQMRETQKQDLAVATLAEKQWSECVALYEKGEDTVAGTCVSANLPLMPGKTSVVPTKTIAQQALEEARSRLGMLQTVGGGKTKTCVFP